MGLSLRANAYEPKRGPDGYFKSKSYDIKQLHSYAESWAVHFGLPIHFVKAQIEQESGWKHNIVSYRGARGLMQIMPETAYCKNKWCLNLDKDESLFNPYVNIYYGCKYMRMLLDMFNGNYDHALMAYYGGPHRMNQILAGEYNNITVIDSIEEYAISVQEKSKKYLNLVADSTL